MQDLRLAFRALRATPVVTAVAVLSLALGVPALLARTFSDADDRHGGADGPVAVISYRFWQRYFGGAGNAVGRSRQLDGSAGL